MNVSKAHSLLAQASAEPDRVQRHLLVAAALREILAQEPIVVGGAAEDHYTGEIYFETDLDMCGWVTESEEALLRDLGFSHLAGERHWVHAASNIAVEFPESFIQGDESRITRIPIRDGIVAIIGIEDLYLDRIRQATSEEDNLDSEAARAGFAVAIAGYDQIDWRYVERSLKKTERDDPALGKPMRIIHRRIRKRLRQVLRTS